LGFSGREIEEKSFEFEVSEEVRLKIA